MSNTIEFVRGDSKFYAIAVTYENSEVPYILQDGDLLVFTVRKDGYRDVLITKTMTNADYDDNGEIPLKINPSDTCKLDFGTYKYDVEVQKKPTPDVPEGDKFTVIEYSDFILTDEITQGGCV